MREGVITEADTCRRACKVDFAAIAPGKPMRELEQTIRAAANGRKSGLEHSDPKDPIASMRSHEAETMCLPGEIEALVAEVQA